MKKRLNIVISILVFFLAAGGIVSSRVLASDGARGVAAGVLSVDAGTLTLQESEDGSAWTPIIGNLTTGYSMVLDPVNPYEYLDIATMTATPALADGMHAFYFDAFRAPDGFFDYWAAQGVVADAAGWQGLMWSIISGDAPMFYLNAASGVYSLVDGFQYQFDGTIAPLRVNGDYPLGTYHFGGYVNEGIADEEYLNIQITFTKTATVSVTPETSTIDGCGYVDIYLHLADVHDLYAVDIELTFDPDVLEVVDLWASDAEPEVNFEPINTWFEAGYWVHNEADNVTGKIRYSATQTNTTAPVDGSGDIARIRFIAKSIGSSDITISKAELSDRDGYLVGRPVNEVGASITTDFSKAAGVDLDIIRLDASTVQLSWPEQTVDSGAGYLLHRSTLPYFDILDPEVVTYDTGFLTSGGSVTYDDAVLGDVVNNYFYGLQVVCSNGFESPLSDQVGKFEFELFESNTTDFGWIGLVLENDSIVNSQDLGNDIEDHIYSGTVMVKTISRWNGNGQIFATYDHGTGGGNFTVLVKQPYRVEIDIDGVSSGSVIWAQVGRLPEITEDTYTLYETATTDYSWILQPLDKVDITNTTQLAQEIESTSSDGVTVLSIARWSGTGQVFSSYARPAESTTRFGYPYRIEVNVLSGASVTWP